MIRDGHVTVNGHAELNPHRWLNLEDDRIEVAGKSVRPAGFRTIMLNKPAGVVTTRSDERGKRTVYSVLGENGSGLIPAGRLDEDTTGLLLLTSDHRLADALTNPRAGIVKTYRVDLDRPLDEVDRKLLARGVEITVHGTMYRTKPAVVSLLALPTRAEITITEGKNRQVRKMFAAAGYEVRSLCRIAIGTQTLGDLPEGEFRELTDEEIAGLKHQVRTRSDR